MKRMIDDYIERFYEPEAKRCNALCADDFAEARRMVKWKENFLNLWNGVKVFDIKQHGELVNTATGDPFKVEAIIDTNGLGDDLGLEMVTYRLEDGEEKFEGTRNFKVVKHEGNVVSYRLETRLRNAGVFRYGFRVYPNNPELPHRQDFAFTRWI